MAINPLLVWHQPIPLPVGPKDPADQEIPRKPGVYVFFRQHGEKVQVFYVGKASKLQGRIRGQLNNHALMTAVANSKNGKRMLVWAELKLRPNQTEPIALRVAEKLMIRHYVEQGQPVHNVQGKRLPTQTLTNTLAKGVKHFVPASVTVDA
jgi:restriction endonuclease Mrr